MKTAEKKISEMTLLEHFAIELACADLSNKEAYKGDALIRYAQWLCDALDKAQAAGGEVPAKPEPEPDMSDPRNWPEGCDVLVRDFKNFRWDIRTFIRFASDGGTPFICRSFDEPTTCGWRYAKRITIHD